ncbi:MULTISPECIES: cytochrome P450 [unclassified Paenibacillus]|uniref:cytochrome P450 n=1 Tax=unclassified Paenibacillus TaxID=185978 RepID=UPI001AEB12F9|nr:MULTISPECIES: cytochrome P450 [unclassified Paenibacillus]MBP1156740.1 cytochrome P450 [Paenibacillus sp. PvP091]MBP1172521.1 cytochrome P450 [Paenibacillus sp. PvR098]MBP2438902.1 cytochrome P450 [Paenibacillus sp. PvP052]
MFAYSNNFFRGTVDGPFPWYEKMRKESPVHYDDQANVWSVFLYEDAKRILGDKDNFSSQFFTVTRENSLSQTIFNMDPPKHTQIRSIVSRAFTPRVMKEWEPRIREITKELLDKASRSNEMDLINDFSHPLPVVIISELLGVPARHIDKLKEWSDILVSTPKDGSEEEIKKWMEAKVRGELELAEFFHGIVEEKRENLGKDIISILIQAEEEGMKLSPEELVPFFNLLLVAGNETTTNLISNAVFSILENPGIYEELRNELSLIPNAVEEALRYRAPAPLIQRVVKEDIEIGGKFLQKGQLVVVFLGSANRDENKFERAHVFDIHRHPNHHIAFGHGNHFCLGAPLARLEAEIALTELVKKFSSLSFPKTFTVDAIENSAVYGLRSFPIVMA